MSHSMTVQNAFTPVAARRTFDQPAAAAGPSPASSAMAAQANTTKVEWPESVRTYVQRAFAVENSIAQVAKSELEAKLKEVIAGSVHAGTLYSTDWAIAALPQQIIVQERQAAYLAPQFSSWNSNESSKPSFYDTKYRPFESSSKKRKSLDQQPGPADEKIPPWKLPHNTRNHFESRVSYADDKAKPLSKSQKRKQRFEQGAFAAYPSASSDSSGLSTPTAEVDSGPVVGRCQTLEKQYFRLTSAPNPDTVRPLPVLEKTLDFLKSKWKKENNYSYICDQLKSLRQDLTVQHIKTAFTVSVYELHARIALEKGDLGEYNQCQTQLRALYSQNFGGHPEEFKAYRILYFIHTCNRTDMNDVLADLTAAEKQHPAIKHALECRSTLALGNYHRFFQLYLETPNMGAYLMDMFVGRERLHALSAICISYKPDVKLRFVTEELGFESDDESARFICDHGGQAFLEVKDDGEVRLLTGKALRAFEPARSAAFQKVDIKGQI